MSDYDKEKWQAEEQAREAASSAYRDKMTKARARSAANAQRKIARLHTKLTELGHISDFEDEFGESVLERLDKFGSAFHDLEKGRPGDALSAAQKQVVARMNRKVKELKAKAAAGEEDEVLDPDAEYTRTAGRWKTDESKPRSSFKSKGKPKFTPRVRHIEDDLDEVEPAPAAPPKRDSFVPRVVIDAPPVTAPKSAPYIPEYEPKKTEAPKRPFLRIVSSDN